MAHSKERDGDLMRPFLIRFLQFLLSKLNGLGKTLRESNFVAELKLKLRSLFHYEQIV